MCRSDWCIFAFFFFFLKRHWSVANNNDKKYRYLEKKIKLFNGYHNSLSLEFCFSRPLDGNSATIRPTGSFFLLLFWFFFKATLSGEFRTERLSKNYYHYLQKNNRAPHSLTTRKNIGKSTPFPRLWLHDKFHDVYFISWIFTRTTRM